MIKARVITIGTEITSGEVVNSNAAWVSTQLEERGVRVFSHLSVRDQRDEIDLALKASVGCEVVIVTGGLGPTSDDLTRECMATYTGVSLEFNDREFKALGQLYSERGLPFREAHKHQCFFPAGSELLSNPVGTALGFAQVFEGRNYFVLPGPPRELEGIWRSEVEPRLRALLPVNPFRWQRWTCLGSPESEVAELVEAEIAGRDLEVGYRAAIPYVKVKVYANESHKDCVDGIRRALAPFTVAEGLVDLAEELFELWPAPEMRVFDALTDGHLSGRLFNSNKSGPQIEIMLTQNRLASPPENAQLVIHAQGEEIVTEMRVGSIKMREAKTLPYKTSLASDRGKRSAAEWALWACVKTLRAAKSQSSTSV